MFKRPLHNIAVLETASGCNLRCPSCVSWTEKGKDLMTLKIAEKAINNIFKPLNFKQVQLYWRGDPCINPNLPEIAQYVQSKGFITVVSTNGGTKYCGQKEYMERLLPNLNHYTVCLDGWNPDNVAKYRVGSKWETMMRNLEIMASVNAPDCDKILAVLMFKHNEGKEDVFIEIAERFGMRVEFKAPDVLGHYLLTEDLADEWLSTEDKNSRYDKVLTSDLPKSMEWRGSDIDIPKLGKYAWVHRSGEKCEDGNLIVAADGTIPFCGQFTRVTNGLGSVDDNIGDILTKYININEDMYNRKLPECGNQCLCIVKPRVQKHEKEFFIDYKADDEINLLNIELCYEILSFKPNSVFEFGCGTGKNLEFIKNEKKSVHATGLDISEWNILKSKEKGIDLTILGDERDFPSMSVDVVFTCQTLSHISDIHNIIGNFQVMAKKAIVIAETNSHSHGTFRTHNYEDYGFIKTNYSFASKDKAEYHIWIYKTLEYLDYELNLLLK